MTPSLKYLCSHHKSSQISKPQQAPNFCPKDGYDLILQSYIWARHFKSDSIDFVMVSWKIKLDNYIISFLVKKLWY